MDHDESIKAAAEALYRREVGAKCLGSPYDQRSISVKKHYERIAEVVWTVYTESINGYRTSGTRPS